MLASLTYALRTLRRHPTYAALNVLGLGLALGCCLLLYWFVRFHQSFEANQPHAARIYRLVTKMHHDAVSYQPGIPTPVVPVLRQADPSLPAVALSIGQKDQLIRVVAADGQLGAKYAEPYGVAFVEPEYFTVFAYDWQAGTPYKSLSQSNTAVLTRRLARKYFGTANPLGRHLRLNQYTELTVTGLIGDIPDNSDQRYELFISFATLGHYRHEGTRLGDWNGVSSQTHGWVLLPPGGTARQLLRQLTTLHRTHHPATLNSYEYQVLPLRAQHFAELYDGPISSATLLVLKGISMLLLLTAGVNFVNLATAQALGRGREIGVRRAVGATRRRVFWQFILETLLLVLAAAEVGLVLARTVLPFLRDWTDTPIPAYLDGPAWALLAALVTGLTLGAGWYPGRMLAGFEPARVLKGEAPTLARGGLWLRRALVVAQLALSQGFLLGVLVMYQQLTVWLTTNPGFATAERVILPTPMLPGADPTRLRAELLQVPGVAEVSFGYDSPLVGTTNTSEVWYDHQAASEPFSIVRLAVDAQYQHLFELPLVAGKSLPPSSGRTGYLVTEAATRLLGAGSPADVIGHQLKLGDGPDVATAAPILGVVRDWRPHGFQQAPMPSALFYSPGEYRAIALRLVPGAGPGTLGAVQAIWNRYFPENLFAAYHLADTLRTYYQREQQQLAIVRLAAGTAIAIGCLGLYGLITFLTRRRVREMGIRRVLGARPGQLVASLLSEFAALLGAAFLVAAPLTAWLLQRWLGQFETHVSLEAWQFAATLLGTLLLTLLTVGSLAWRASAAPPAPALRPV